MAHLPGSNNVFSCILLLFLRTFLLCFVKEKNLEVLTNKSPSDWPYDATDALG